MHAVLGSGAAVDTFCEGFLAHRRFQKEQRVCRRRPAVHARMQVVAKKTADTAAALPVEQAASASEAPAEEKAGRRRRKK